MTNIVKGLLGGKPRGAKVLENFRPTDFQSAGLSGTFDKTTNSVALRRSAGLTGALGQQGQAFRQRIEALRRGADALSVFNPQLAGIGTNLRASTAAASGTLANINAQLAGLPIGQFDQLRARIAGQTAGLLGLRDEVRGLRGEVRPGIGRATEARVAALRNQQRQAVGNLREELDKRRVLGSSFAAREIGALNSQFAQQEDQIRADAFLQELSATGTLLGMEADITGQQNAFTLAQNEQTAGLLRDSISTAFGVLQEQAQNTATEAALAQGLSEQEADLVGRQQANVAAQFQLRAEATTAAIQSVQEVLKQLNLESTLAADLAQNGSQMNLNALLGQAEAYTAQDAQLTDLVASLASSAGGFFGDLLG